MLAQVASNGFLVRMSPADAERVAGWVGVDLVSLGAGKVLCRLQQTSAESKGLSMRASQIVDVEVEMDLLRIPIRPFRRDVSRCELDADHPSPLAVKDAVPRVVDENAAADHASPEGALGGQISRIEHDHLSHNLHSDIVAVMGAAWARRREEDVSVEERLASLGLSLPDEPKVPPGVEIPFQWVRVRGTRALVSGHGALAPDGSAVGPFGKVPSEVALEAAQHSASLAALAIRRVSNAPSATSIE